MKSQLIKSKATDETYNLATVLSRIKNGTAIVWQFNGLITGKITNEVVTWSGGFEPDEELIVEGRFFNVDKEFYFRKSGETLTGRLREDSIGDDSEVVDISNFLWGTTGIFQKEGFTELTENNGMCISLLGDYAMVSPEKRVNLIIRNYIDYNERHMAGYVDARFVEIKIA